MAILLNVLLAIYVLVALLMMLVILMQRPKSEGLGAAFGGGVTENIFGAQTTNVLTKITAWLAGIFFLLTFVLSILYAQRGGASSGIRRELMKDQPAAAVPATTGSPAAPTASPAAPASPAGAQPNNLPPEGAEASPATTQPTVAPAADAPPQAATPSPAATVSPAP